MTAPDLIRFATYALGQHRRRTGLSLLGVAIGVVAVITLTALGEGARRYVEDQFSALGSNLLIVLPGKTDTTGGFPGAGGAPNDLTLDDARALAREIPGVRRVLTGTAVREESKYKFCWLIEFVHEKVIENYRQHPEHVAFANNLFRPIAGDRVSIDFLQN